MRDQRKSASEYTTHEHVCSKRARREHEVRIDQIIDGALKDGEEAETNAGGADAESGVSLA